MKLDERHLIQLAAVVQAGGVGQAAALLGMTQPALSRTLGLLERRLGQELFVKGRRPLQPTALGRALAEHGQTMLTASRKASETVSSFRDGRMGTIRLGGTPFFMDALISTMIAGFSEGRPEAVVTLSYGYLAELRALLDADRIDVAVCPVDVLGEGSGLVFQELLPGRNVVACRTTHPLLLRRSLKGHELLDFPWIAPPPGSPLHADLRAILLSLGAMEPRTRYSGGSLASVVNYMAATDALAVMPHGFVFALRDTHAVTALPLKVPHPERALGLLRSANGSNSPMLDLFTAYLVERFKSLRTLIKRHEGAVIWQS